jgi:phosphopantetheinyl transferase
MIIVIQKQLSNHQTIALAEVDYNQEKELFDLLSANNIDLSELKTIKSTNRKIEWMSIRSLFLKIDPDFSDIYYDSHRKPFLRNQDHHISISHSHHRVAVFLDKKHICGVDLQHLTPKISRIKEKFLKPEELDRFAHDVKTLTLLWSIKEALFKIYGKKDIYLKDDISVTSLNFSNNEGNANARFDFEKNEHIYNLNVEIIDDYALAYVVNY